MTKDIEPIYKALLNEIISLKLKPGARLKEEEVSVKYGVSRTPIRDVFKRLELNRLLEVYPQCGTFVTRIDLGMMSSLMYVRASTEFVTLLSLFKTITPGDIAQIRMLLENQKTALEKGFDSPEFPDEFFKADNEFHTELYKKAGKEDALKLLNESFPYYSRYRYLTFLRDKHEIEELYKRHSQIVDVLEEKNEAKLYEVCMEHNFSGLHGIKSVQERHPDYFVEGGKEKA
jgi:DNA-binding GntR family transcriptional regulator